MVARNLPNLSTGIITLLAIATVLSGCATPTRFVSSVIAMDAPSLRMASHIIEWTAWIATLYFALTFAIGCRVYAKRGIGFQWATATQTMLFWVATIVFLIAPVNKMYLFCVIPLILTDQLVLWLIRHGLPERVILYVPSPVRILLIASGPRFVTFVFMQIILLGVRTPQVTAEPPPCGLEDD